MLSDTELTEIEERHNERKEYRADLPPGLWGYESFAFLENYSDFDTGLVVALEERVCILVRRRVWIDALMRACGESILDEGTVARRDEKDNQPAHVGQYIEKLMDGSVEQDVSLLLEEVRRLRGLQSTK